MFYRLNENYLLRGWQKLPYGVVDIRNGKTTFVSKEIMDVLDFSNGKIDFDLPLISDRYREIAKKLEEEGTLIRSEQPMPILEKQKYCFHDNRFMEAAHWSISGRCNYKCKHCYMSACEGKCGELSHEEVVRIIDELAACGVHRISLTGGEALIRKDFFENIDALIENDIIFMQVQVQFQ